MKENFKNYTKISLGLAIPIYLIIFSALFFGGLAILAWIPIAFIGAVLFICSLLIDLNYNY